jgi:hypothetical protein
VPGIHTSPDGIPYHGVDTLRRDASLKAIFIPVDDPVPIPVLVPVLELLMKLGVILDAVCKYR